MKPFPLPAVSILALVSTLIGGTPADLDFWIGEWEVSWKDPQGNPKSGTNTIARALGDKVIHERFDGRPGIDFIGESWSVYVEGEDIWKQTWVDNQGGYLDFTGGMQADEMILSRKGLSKGKPALQRMRFHNITKASLDWAWEISFDDGETWQLAWLIHYSRKPAGPPES